MQGRTFGRLRVLRRCPPGGYRESSAWWRCICDPAFGGCGREVSVVGTSLRKGLTRSCGCLRSGKARGWLRAINGRKRRASK